MRRTTILIVTVLVVGSLAAMPLSGLAQTTDTATASNASAGATNERVAPGEQLAGVVGVQGAELDGEVQSRAYGVRVAQTAGNDSRAAVAAAQLSDLERRLSVLEQRREALQTARENGSLSEGAYRARMARLAAQTRSVERLANQTNETAQALPAETLRANGVDVTAIRTLSDRAENLIGPEVARIAREIAGDRVGEGFGPAHAGDRGPDDRRSTDRGPSDPANASEDRDRPDSTAERHDSTRTVGNASNDAARDTATETATATDG